MNIITDRAAMIDIVKAVKDTDFQSEIRYFTNDIEERDYVYDELSALFDILDRNDQKDGDKRLLKVARQVLIDLGFFRIMPQDEIDNTYTSSGRSPWDFKLGGVPYTTDETHEHWQFPDEGEEAA